MNAILKQYGWAFALIALMLLVLLIMYPRPTAEGHCGMSCTTGTNTVHYPETGESLDLSGICNIGTEKCSCCEVTSVTQSIIMDGWNVGWKCCNCVGEGELSLPDCDSTPLGFIYEFIGACS